MTPAILDKLTQYRDRYGIGTGSILEVGSRDINGSPRSVFTNADSYIGMDKEAGKGVDVVQDYVHTYTDARNLRCFPISNLVICCETIEHEPQFWKIVKNLYQDCKPGGHIIISAPTNGFPEHRHPVDCYRFMPDAFKAFYTEKQCKLLELNRVIDTMGNPGLIAIWQKHDFTKYSLEAQAENAFQYAGIN